MSDSIVTSSQTKVFKKKLKNGYIDAVVRWDDQCNNGLNYFSITGHIVDGKGEEVCSGCIHEEISKHFPELAPFIKYHLFDSTGPMHYIANTVYHAGSRDHRGLLKGEQRQLVNGKTGLKCWILSSHSLERYIDAEECPKESALVHYEPWMIVGEGKERNLDAARSSACWPEATDEQLMADSKELTKMLKARLPALMEEFKAAVKSLGFNW